MSQQTSQLPLLCEDYTITYCIRLHLFILRVCSLTANERIQGKISYDKQMSDDSIIIIIITIIISSGQYYNYYIIVITSIILDKVTG